MYSCTKNLSFRPPSPKLRGEGLEDKFQLPDWKCHSNPNQEFLKIKSLISQLSDLEASLHSFSFEELSIEEAKRLRTSFDEFKARFEEDFWGGPDQNSNRVPGERDRADDKIIATVSHELRTPLNGIIGFADLLGESSLSAEQQQQVSAIQAASRSLLEIINELLEYSKLNAGQEVFEEVDFNFRAVIDEVAYLCKTLIIDKKITFQVTVDPEIPEFLVGDPAKLSQVLLNILGNAIKFVDQGQITLRIDALTQKNKIVTIGFEITDTGIGISKKDLAHIFQSFKQAKPGTFAKYGGTGLGLSIVKQIVERLNGSLELTSTLGKGTTVNISIPYAFGSPVKEEPEPGLVSAEAVKGLTVLAFEDDKFNRWILEKRLNAWGCKYYITDNADYGLSLLRESSIDLVLMDLHLPGTDGFSITERIRNNAAAHVHNVPVIAISADIRIADEIKCQESGIDDFILKPYTPEELLLKMISATKLVKEGAYTVKPVRAIPETTPEDTASVDLKPLLNECLGQVELIEELAVLYKRNILEFLGQMKLHLQNRDVAGIEFATHKIKAGLKIIPSPGLLRIVEAMHTLASEDRDTTVMKSLYEAFIAHYPEVEKALDKEIEALKP